MLATAIALLLVLAAHASQPSLTPGACASSITREGTNSHLFIRDRVLTLTEENGYSLRDASLVPTILVD